MSEYNKLVNLQQEITGKVTKKDFQMLSVIGKGSYGKVLLVKKNDDTDPTRLYAMKVLKKLQLVERKQVEHTMTERRILVTLFRTHIPSIRKV